MKKNNTKRELGKIKAWADVSFWYYQKLLQIVTAVGVLRLTGMEWWLLGLLGFLCIPTLILIVHFHMKYVYSSELQYLQDKQPIFRELRENLKCLVEGSNYKWMNSEDLK